MPMDRKRYPADWEEIARRVKEEAGWTCQRCGKQCRRPGEPFDTHKRTLTVHHVDHVPENCDPANLVALCAPCHLRADAKHHAQTRRGRRSADDAQSGTDAHKACKQGRRGQINNECGEIMAADESR